MGSDPERGDAVSKGKVMGVADSVLEEMVASCKRKAKKEVRAELNKLKADLREEKRLRTTAERRFFKLSDQLAKMEDYFFWVDSYFKDTIEAGKWAAKEYEKFKKRKKDLMR